MLVSDNVCVITGAWQRGPGRATARLSAQNGGRVAALDVGRFAQPSIQAHRPALAGALGGR